MDLRDYGPGFWDYDPDMWDYARLGARFGDLRPECWFGGCIYGIWAWFCRIWVLIGGIGVGFVGLWAVFVGLCQIRARFGDLRLKPGFWAWICGIWACICGIWVPISGLGGGICGIMTPICGITQDGGGVGALSTALAILEKYGRNLLQPRPPPFWRCMRATNPVFRSTVGALKVSTSTHQYGPMPSQYAPGPRWCLPSTAQYP